MRQRDRRTVGGLVVIGLAVWIAAWLLRPGESGAARQPAQSLAIVDRASLPESHAVAPADAESRAAPAALLDERAAAAAASVEASWPGESVHLKGRIVGADGQPVAQALVTHWPTAMQRDQVGLGHDEIFLSGIDWTRLASTRSGPDGSFVLDVHDQTLGRQALGTAGLPGLFADGMEARPVLLVEHPEQQTLAVYVTTERGGDVDVGTIVLAPGSTLTGRLVDPNGRARAGVPLGIELADSHIEYEKRRLELQTERTIAVSDETGRFRITGLWPGQFSLDTRATDLAPLTQAVTIAGPGELDLGNVLLAIGGRLGGIVLDARDRPLPGAELRVRPNYGVKEGPDAGALEWDRIVHYGKREIRHDAVAGADGRFTVSGLWDQGTRGFDVIARADGFDPCLISGAAAGRDDLVLRLEREASWRLRVVEATGGGPVPGATLFGRRAPGQDDGGEGRRLDALLDGDVFVLRGAGRTSTLAVASAPGHATRVLPLPGLGAGEEREETVSLLRESVLAGRVTDDEQQRQAGVVVRLTPPPGPYKPEPAGQEAQQLFTDADGRFRFAGLGAGVWSLETTAHGCVAMWAPLQVTLRDEESIEDLQVVLLRGATITGVVVEADGAPVADTWVIAQSKSTEALAAAAESGRPGETPDVTAPMRTLRTSSYTDREGRFTLAGVAPGEWNIDAQKGAEATVTITGRETVDVVLKRQQPPRVIGRVTRSGQPVTGALVDLGFGPDIGNSEWIQLAATRTDASGRYELEYASDDTWYLQATADGITSRAVQVTLAWNRTETVDIAMPTGRVHGRVVDTTGSPVSGAKLALGDPAALARRDEDPFGQATTSAPDGSFSFEPVGAGTWLIVADPGGASSSAPARQTVTLVEGQPLRDVTVTLQPGASVEVTAVSSAKLRLGLRPAEGGSEAHPKHTSEGTYLFTRLAAGEWELTVQRLENKKWPLVHSEKVSVSPGQTLAVQVQLAD